MTTEQRMIHRATVLFTLVIIGCKVTSRLFVMGKCFPVNKIKSDFHFCQQAIMVFNQVGQAKQNIVV